MRLLALPWRRALAAKARSCSRAGAKGWLPGRPQGKMQLDETQKRKPRLHAAGRVETEENRVKIKNKVKTRCPAYMPS
jgi:hypothetical protein